MCFRNLHIGNRAFKLFSHVPTEDNGALVFPLSTHSSSPEDRANLETIMHLLQKTKSLRLEKLEHTWTVLKVIGHCPERFESIRSLHIEVNERNLESILAIPEEFMAHIYELGLEDAIFGIEPGSFVAAASALISKTRTLHNLILNPTKKIEWISVLAENAHKLKCLVSLTLSAAFPLVTTPKEVTRAPSEFMSEEQSRITFAQQSQGQLDQLRS